MKQRIKDERSETAMNTEFLKKMPGGVAILKTGMYWELIDGNEEFYRSIGYTKEEIFEMPDGVNSILYKPDIKVIKRLWSEAMRKERTGEYELRIITRHGRIHWFVMRASFYGKQDGVAYYLVSVWDIHGHKKVEEQLHVQKEKYQMVEDITGEMPFDYDVDSGEMLISNKYLMVRGMHEVLEHYGKWKEQKDIIYYKDYEKFYRAMERAAKVEQNGALELRLNISNPHEAPQYAWYRINYKSIPGMNGTIVRILGRIINIHQEKLDQALMAEQAKRDGLTGMLNKAAIQSKIDRYLLESNQGSHALFIIDIDNFKAINDTFGHLFGDTVLMNIAEEILGIFRGSDIVGRIGGDEFLVLMKNVTKAQIEEKASLACQKVLHSYAGEEGKVEISCSIGIALYGQDGQDFGTLFQKADTAMYEVKEQGKNMYKFVDADDRPTGFRRERKEEWCDSSTTAKGRDRDFLVDAFALLSHARELNSSLNLLMERIGRRYSLSVVAVLVEEAKSGELVQTNCWRVDLGIVENPMFFDKYGGWEGYKKGYDARGISYINDCLGNEVPENNKEEFRQRQIRALVNCRFSYRDTKFGIISFCDLNEPREWTDFEKGTFLELSKLIAVFVSLRNRQDEDKKAIALLKKLDSLTGLYNEEAFLDKAREKLDNMDTNKVYALVYNDIVNFSYINENYGQEAGNQILKDYAELISKEDKVFSSRLHSDMFMSLVTDENRETIRIRVEQDARNFMERQRSRYPQSNLRLSIGIYFFERKNEDLEVAIENANMARKSLKRDTANAICRVYNQELRWQREVEKQIVEEFAEAIKEKRFQVYLQPQFALRDKTLFGAEALVRWNRKDGALEFPNAFIPVLERTGYIVELDFYVLEQVLSYMQKWKSEKKQLHQISINFSKRHFDGGGVYKRVKRLAEQYEIESAYIGIEITESLLVSGNKMVKKEMECLHREGYFVSIDDFGAGYSSLSTLRDVPADVIKIDKSFLQHENLEEEQEFIVNMGELLHSVKGEIIFQGIETIRQFEFLADCGFHYGQGFLLDRPMPLRVFEEKYMN